jgi:hypothetical protein
VERQRAVARRRALVAVGAVLALAALALHVATRQDGADGGGEVAGARPAAAAPPPAARADPIAVPAHAAATAGGSEAPSARIELAAAPDADWEAVAGIEPGAGGALARATKWQVAFDAAALRRLVPGSALAVALPDGDALVARVERRVAHGNGDVSLVARSGGAARLPVVLTVGEQAVFATIATPAGTLELRGAGDRGLLVPAAELDASGEGLDDAVPPPVRLLAPRRPERPPGPAVRRDGAVPG